MVTIRSLDERQGMSNERTEAYVTTHTLATCFVTCVACAAAPFNVRKRTTGACEACLGSSHLIQAVSSYHSPNEVFGNELLQAYKEVHWNEKRRQVTKPSVKGRIVTNFCVIANFLFLHFILQMILLLTLASSFSFAKESFSFLSSGESLGAPPSRIVSLKVINYNVWHGLGGGFFKRKELEPASHKEKRYKKQMVDFKKYRPDILFLQEVNPVDSLTKKMAEELHMSYVFQNTNCGMSIWGMGFPVNLNMGIAILARPPLKIKKIIGLKLSGPIGACNPYLTFQYAEFRYALFALAEHPRYGHFLLINTHFHHGVEWNHKVRRQINIWERQKMLTSSERVELEETIEASNSRRKKEVTKLFSQLYKLQRQYGNLPVIFAGDLNSTVNSPIYKKIIDTYQMKDSMVAYSPTPYTWDAVRNRKNHQYTANFGVPVPTFNKREIESFFQENNRWRRRIDYVFVSPDVRVYSSSLYGDQPNAEVIIGSDHFGVFVVVDFGLMRN